MRFCTALLSFVPLFAFGATAHGDVLAAVSQNRAVSGTAFASDANDDASDSDSDAATDFGPFGAGAAANAVVFDALGSGGGTQNSMIAGTTITALGSSFANGEGYCSEGPAAVRGRPRSPSPSTCSSRRTTRCPATSKPPTTVGLR